MRTGYHGDAMYRRRRCANRIACPCSDTGPSILQFAASRPNVSKKGAPGIAISTATKYLLDGLRAGLMATTEPTAYGFNPAAACQALGWTHADAHALFVLYRRRPSGVAPRDTSSAVLQRLAS